MAHREERGEHLGVGGPQQQGSVLEEVADADGGDQHRQRGSRPQRLIGQPLHHNAQHRADHNGQQNAHNRGQGVF